MKSIHGFTKKFLDASAAKSAAQFMRIVCCFAMAGMVFSVILSCMGRQTFILHSKTGTYDRAIYAEENHEPRSRGVTVQISDDEIHVWTNEEDRIDPITHIGLSVMFGLQAIPVIFAYWFLSRVFGNVHSGKIFIEENAKNLLYYGLIQMFVAFFVPFLKLLVCFLVSHISSSRVSISTGQGMLESLIPSIAFLVAAYIIHYGIGLQDEVDHTI